MDASGLVVGVRRQEFDGRVSWRVSLLEPGAESALVIKVNSDPGLKIGDLAHFNAEIRQGNFEGRGYVTVVGVLVGVDRLGFDVYDAATRAKVRSTLGG